MYTKLLVATDGSVASEKAVEHGVRLAQETDAPVVLLTATEPWSALDVARAADAGVANPVEEYEALAVKSAQLALEPAERLAKGAGVTYEIVHAPDSLPADAIVAAARKHGCDLIVMGTHGRRGLDRILLGSQAAKVLTLADVPVLVVR